MSAAPTLAAGPVPSPCRSICRMHASAGVCIGCGRTIDEIAWWSALDEEDKRAVWALLPQRLAELPPTDDAPPLPAAG